jgi:hypothetical protein
VRSDISKRAACLTLSGATKGACRGAAPKHDGSCRQRGQRELRPRRSERMRAPVGLVRQSPRRVSRSGLQIDNACEGIEPEHDNLLSDVSWVCLERGGVRIRSAVEAATKRRLGDGFHMPRATTHAGRDALLHHSLDGLAAPDAGRRSLRLRHGRSKPRNGRRLMLIRLARSTAIRADLAWRAEARLRVESP